MIVDKNPDHQKLVTKTILSGTALSPNADVIESQLHYLRMAEIEPKSLFSLSFPLQKHQ